MCYHRLYLFLACGHTVPSHRPIPHAPPCPIQTSELGRKPSRSSPIESSSHKPWRSEEDIAREVANHHRCAEQLSHPMHTFRIDRLCLHCIQDCEQRLAAFEVCAIRGDVNRAFVRRKTEGEKGGMKKVMRIMRSTGLSANGKMLLDGGDPDAYAPYREGFEKLVVGVKEMVGWEEEFSRTVEILTA